MADEQKALVLFSGGQDSATCLAWALEKFDEVETLGFDYSQNHIVELDVRLEFLSSYRKENQKFADKLSSDHLLDLGVLARLVIRVLQKRGIRI